MSDQFILMSRANAISNGRPIVHAAITGKSAFIDHKGRVISKTELFETVVLTEKIHAKQKETPYSKYGNYLNYLPLMFIFIIKKQSISLSAVKVSLFF